MVMMGVVMCGTGLSSIVGETHIVNGRMGWELDRTRVVYGSLSMTGGKSFRDV